MYQPLSKQHDERSPWGCSRFSSPTPQETLWRALEALNMTLRIVRQHKHFHRVYATLSLDISVMGLPELPKRSPFEQPRAVVAARKINYLFILEFYLLLLHLCVDFGNYARQRIVPTFFLCSTKRAVSLFIWNNQRNHSSYCSIYMYRTNTNYHKKFDKTDSIKSSNNVHD